MTVVVELAAGHATGSLALSAEGWHMATHAGVLGLSVFAYWFARTRAADGSFSFGTGKVYALAGYTSALALSAAALWMLAECAARLSDPEGVDFVEALPVAVLGLLVNVGCAMLLSQPPSEHAHDGEPARAGDYNHRAVYYHVVSDAFTSVVAIAGLAGGWFLDWTVRGCNLSRTAKGRWGNRLRNVESRWINRRRFRRVGATTARCGSRVKVNERARILRSRRGSPSVENPSAF